MTILFYCLGVAAVVSAIMVVTRSNAVHSALWLILTFFAVAGLFVLQGAEFIAAAQVFVYAGGIMVLFLFVIMLVNIEQVERHVRTRRHVSAAVGLSALTVVTVGAVVAGAGVPTSIPIAGGGLETELPGKSLVEGVDVGNLEAVGMNLLTGYLLPFELVSIVLFVAIIGAIVLCRRQF